MKVDQRQLVEAVQRFLFHLSMVNSEVAHFYARNGKDDTLHQEKYAEDWAEKLVEIVDPESAYGLRETLEDYKDSVRVWSAVRIHASHLMVGTETLGLEVYEKLKEDNPEADLNTDRSLSQMAESLSITKDDAAYLKAYLLFGKK